MLPPRQINALAASQYPTPTQGYGGPPPVNALAAMENGQMFPGASAGIPFAGMQDPAMGGAWPPMGAYEAPSMQPIMKIDATGYGPPVVSVLKGHKDMLEGTGPYGLGSWADGGTYSPRTPKDEGRGEWRLRSDVPMSRPLPQNLASLMAEPLGVSAAERSDAIPASPRASRRSSAASQNGSDGSGSWVTGSDVKTALRKSQRGNGG